MLEAVLFSSNASAGVGIKYAMMGVCPVILTETGNLYVTGNAGRLANDGSTSTVLTSWKLIDSDVEMVGMIGGGSLLWRKTNKKWMAIGVVNYIFNSLTTATTTDVTNFCSVIPNDVKIKQISGTSGVNAYVVGEDGSIYGCGRNAWQALGDALPSAAASAQPSFIVMPNLGGARITVADAAAEHSLFVSTDKRLLMVGNEDRGVGGTARVGLTPNGRTIATDVDKFCFGVYATHYLSGTTLYSAGVQMQGQLGDGVIGTTVNNNRKSWYVHPETVLDVMANTYALYAKLADGWYFAGATYTETNTDKIYASLTKLDTTGLRNPQFLYTQYPAVQFALDLSDNTIAVKGRTGYYNIPVPGTFQANWVKMSMAGVV